MSRLIISVSGVRGIFGDSLTPQIAKQFGEAFAATLPAGATIVLGRDSRPSGQSLRDAVIEGLISHGINVIDIGIATTPGTAVMVKHLSADGGIVITASHNPPAYNGLKFLSSEGRNLPADRANKLKEIWESRNFSPTETSGRVSINNDVHK
ncbi:MAG: phosphoglucosamine mutase, partial [Planctomycetes bacterium]|nr:phosphoglucosamine mutase [Planctomycetota bacterium]